MQNIPTTKKSVCSLKFEDKYEKYHLSQIMTETMKFEEAKKIK